MVKCIIIDDEPKARKLLEAIIQQYCVDLTIEALCEDLPSGVKAIRKHQPQLVFLDIEMPGHSGLELMDFFNADEINFSIIFTTAYNEYALQAFKLSAIDYLLKPIQHKELIESVERFKKNQLIKQSQQIKVLQQNLNTQIPLADKRIVVSSGQSLHFINPTNIIMLKGESSYSELYLSDGSKMLASKNLKHFEEALSAFPSFIRCHKSFIVNTKYVLQYVKSDGGYLSLSNNLNASISPEKVDIFLEAMR